LLGSISLVSKAMLILLIDPARGGYLDEEDRDIKKEM